ncbi:hypothetical protein ANCCAN_29588 [Ancylostoma caninum]|uniref:Uncharacterized protein n=1 Tax=Ancylostoma caninum TaxID=29170 RepID=A0A368F139_ANCCA|nr:hypothetical protein ANCCAN_29588 [Ancylostoma caninum]
MFGKPIGCRVFPLQTFHTNASQQSWKRIQVCCSLR